MQIIFGTHARRTGESDSLSWNEEFIFTKTNENRLGVQVFSKGGEVLIGMQEIGINTFIKKLNTVDHVVELMNEGVAVGEVLLCFDYLPNVSPSQQWNNVGIDQRKKVTLHKLHLSKLKAVIDSEEVGRIA